MFYRSIVHATLVSMCYLVFASGQTAQAALVADYWFAYNFDSQIPGAPALVQAGPGPGVFGSTVISGNPVYTWTFPEHTGLSFDNSLATIPNNEYTVAMQFKATGLVADYQALLMTDNFLTENHPYITNTGKLQDYPYSTGSTTLVSDTYYTLALTRTASNTVKIYLDGVLETTDVGVAASHLTISAAKLMHFFRDNTGDEEMGGTVSRIQLYNTVLSDVQIAALDLSDEPPPPAPEPSTLLVASLGLISICTLRRRRQR